MLQFVALILLFLDSFDKQDVYFVLVEDFLFFSHY